MSKSIKKLELLKIFIIFYYNNKNKIFIWESKMNKFTLRDTYIPNYQMAKSKGMEIIRRWRLTKKIENHSLALKPGNMLFVAKYDAQVVDRWDETPVILILRVTKTHVLAFNINWLARQDRERMIRYFIKAYQGNGLRPMGRIERLREFNKIRRFKFPKAAYRVYMREQLRSTRLYSLTLGDFWEALTHNLLNVTETKQK